MEEKLKFITAKINEELIKLFGAKIERIILYGSYGRGDFDNDRCFGDDIGQ